MYNVYGTVLLTAASTAKACAPGETEGLATFFCCLLATGCPGCCVEVGMDDLTCPAVVVTPLSSVA